MTQMDADERHEDLTGMDRIYRIRILSHHEVHEGNEVKPGSAGRLTGFRDFAFGDQSRACGTVGSRPAGRRWQVIEKQCFVCSPAIAGRTVPPDFRHWV